MKEELRIEEVCGVKVNKICPEINEMDREEEDNNKNKINNKKKTQTMYGLYPSQQKLDSVDCKKRDVVFCW